ncbi:hypothetical protein C6356_00660 [Bacillus wiedmannii]|uniref:hypothetical protein n=1 Tax=Bacillus wiedmannii TaxID=1890302 RepID=UPI000D08FA5E|nr:hypothetical protein [Bacillus wiedmannii]PRT06968.1 hypothetical protein C6356_00660 [Bacillus wiedmannii]
MSKNSGFFKGLYEEYRSGKPSEKLSIISNIFTIFGASVGVIFAQIFVYIKFKMTFLIAVSFSLVVLAAGLMVAALCLWAFSTIINGKMHIILKIAGAIICIALIIIFSVWFYSLLDLFFSAA